MKKETDDYIGYCNLCGREDEICPDTGMCQKCQDKYAKEQALIEGHKELLKEIGRL